MDQRQKNPVRVFVSFHPEDKELYDEFIMHLDNLKRQGHIDIWSFNDILAGANLAEKMDYYQERASVIFLMTSPDFMSDRNCRIQMERALQQRQESQIQVIPILLRQMDLKDSPLATLLCLPRDGKPIKERLHRDGVWKDIIEEIRRVIECPDHLLVNTAAPSSPKRWNIPYPRAHFFTGRKDELNLLHEQLLQNHTAAISGLSGIGKTVLAIEYASHHQDIYQYVLWVNADSTKALNSSYAEIAKQLDLDKNTTDQKVIVQAVKTWLKFHQDYLIILDNADKPKLLDQFIPSDKRGHVLITTRAADLTALKLGIVKPLQLPSFTDEQGILFLLYRADLLALNNTDLSQIDHQKYEQAKQLVHALRGFPLALDLAGAYLRTTKCGLDRYLDLYRLRGPHLLDESCDDGPSRQVTTIWAISFKKVADDNAAAAELLRLCAFLAPDAIPETILKKGAKELGPVLTPVAFDDHELNLAIKVLRNYSLIERNQSEDTLIIHRFVQDILQANLSADDQQRWKLRAVQVVNATLPILEHSDWTVCEEWLPHVFICDTWIKEGGVPSLIASHLLNWTGCYLRERARYDEAKPYLERALAISTSAHTATFLAVTTDLTNLAYLHWNRGEYEEAEKLLLRAQAIYEGRSKYDESFSNDEKLQYVEILQNLACTYQTRGKYNDAEKLFKHALKRAGEATPLIRAVIQSNQAELYRRLGRYSEADTLLKAALRMKELAPEDLKTAQILHKQALLSYDQRKYNEAEQLFERALVIYTKHRGSEHPDTAQILHGRAEVYRVQGKFEEAEMLFKRVLTLMKQKLGDNHSSLAAVLNGLALLYLEQGKYIYVKQEGQKGYMKQGRYQEAEDLLQEALRIRKARLGSQHPDTALCLHNLALLYSAQEEMYNEAEERFESTQEKYKKAEELFEQALAIWQKQLSSEHPYILHTSYHLGRLSQAQGSYEKAKDIFQHLLEIQQCRFDQEDAEIILRLDDLAFLSYEQKRYEEAEMYFQQILAIYEECLGPEHLGTQDVRRNFTSLLQIVGRDLRFSLQIDENIPDENS
jgi:tetratricopeptide (TPR) repeat protein